jgi:hypothetical protein
MNRHPAILDWASYIPNTFIFISKRTADQLTHELRKHINDNGRFVILDCKTDRNGWLPEEAWEMMRKSGTE